MTTTIRNSKTNSRNSTKTSKTESVKPVVEYTKEQIDAHYEKMRPLIRMTAEYAFRKEDPDKREEAVQNVEAWSWELYMRLVNQGRMDEAFATPLAWFGIKKHREGRIYGVGYNSTDVLADGTRCLGRSTIKHYAYSIGSSVMDARNPVDEIVQFRIDFSDWYDRHSERDQWMITDLAMGHTTNEVAKKFGVSAAAISQFRRRCENLWKRFIDPPEAGMLVPA